MIDTSSVVLTYGSPTHRQCGITVGAFKKHLRHKIHTYNEFFMSKVIIEKALKKVNTFPQLLNIIHFLHLLWKFFLKIILFSSIIITIVSFDTT